MWKFPFIIITFKRGKSAPWRKRMYINSLTQQAQTALTHAFQVTERSGNTLQELIRGAQSEGAFPGSLATASTAITTAQVAIQAVKNVMESPGGTADVGALGGNTQEVRALAQELLRKLG